LFCFCQENEIIESNAVIALREQSGVVVVVGFYCRSKIKRAKSYANFLRRPMQYAMLRSMEHQPEHLA
jgi:hypothetical protein